MSCVNLNRSAKALADVETRKLINARIKALTTNVDPDGLLNTQEFWSSAIIQYMVDRIKGATTRKFFSALGTTACGAEQICLLHGEDLYVVLNGVCWGLCNIPHSDAAGVIAPHKDSDLQLASRLNIMTVQNYLAEISKSQAHAIWNRQGIAHLPSGRISVAVVECLVTRHLAAKRLSDPNTEQATIQLGERVKLGSISRMSARDLVALVRLDLYHINGDIKFSRKVPVIEQLKHVAIICRCPVTDKELDLVHRLFTPLLCLMNNPPEPPYTDRIYFLLHDLLSFESATTRRIVGACFEYLVGCVRVGLLEYTKYVETMKTLFEQLLPLGDEMDTMENIIDSSWRSRQDMLSFGEAADNVKNNLLRRADFAEKVNSDLPNKWRNLHEPLWCFYTERALILVQANFPIYIVLAIMEDVCWLAHSVYNVNKLMGFIQSVCHSRHRSLEEASKRPRLEDEPK